MDHDRTRTFSSETCCQVRPFVDGGDRDDLTTKNYFDCRNYDDDLADLRMDSNRNLKQSENVFDFDEEKKFSSCKNLILKREIQGKTSELVMLSHQYE